MIASPESPSTESYTIGVDLGTSSVKVVAIRVDGSVAGRARREYPTHRPVAGAAEQSTVDWVRAIVDALTSLSAELPASTWTAIGLSAMLPTLVLLDRDGLPIGHAITWQDSRAEADVDTALSAVEGVDYPVTGQRVDGRYLLPMFERFRREYPNRAELVDQLVGAKDFLFAMLTGELLTDPSTAAGYGNYDLTAGGWLPTTGFPSQPPVAAAATTRPIRPEFAKLFGVRAGLPVVLGAADSVLGCLGLGATGAGDIAYVAGTSTVIVGVAGDDYVPDPDGRFLVTPLTGSDQTPAQFGYELDLVATGSAFEWLAKFTGSPDVPSLIAAAELVDPATAPVVRPYFGSGEQGALWDPTLRGGISGLTLDSTPAEVARGLLSGIVLESRRCLAVLAESSRNRGSTGRLLVTGTSATSAVFLQDLADATGRTVHTTGTESDHSAIGAAMLAASASGAPIKRRAAVDGAQIFPRPAHRALWDRLATQLDNERGSGS
jgi:xylulokinase